MEFAYTCFADAVSTVIDRFLGVPFAKPPVGEWRFKVSLQAFRIFDGLRIDF